MDDDNLFRWIFVGGFVSMAPIGLYHRLRSQSTKESLDRLQEGLFILIGLRLLGLAAFAGMFAYMFNPATLAPASLPMPVWARWIGVALGIVDIFLLTWVFRSIGANITDTVVTRKEHTLITHGPYRYARHPFYGCFALTLVCATLVTATWYFALTGGIAFILIVIRTKVEEEKLIERFGDDYRAYMASTPRFLPSLRKFWVRAR